MFVKNYIIIFVINVIYFFLVDCLRLESNVKKSYERLIYNLLSKIDYCCLKHLISILLPRLHETGYCEVSKAPFDGSPGVGVSSVK